ncbi:acyclic terpene utilization AtuA family protein [Achromobacter denitrificans]
MSASYNESRARRPKGPVHVGCASGFWGDSQIAIPQLLTAEKLDYIVFDYLAETTMSILQRARMRNPELGYATDFVSVLRPHLKTLLERGVRLVSNAGGLNPQACRDAILAFAREQGLAPRIAVVTGDDVAALQAEFTDAQGRHLADLDGFGPLLSANAYLGAYPIVQALALDVDIVITGRAVDSACALAVAIHEFDWAFSDYDKLAQASLAGHLIECGPQATGGLFTDWEAVPDWANIGYPIVVLDSEGGFDLTKPPGTGGLVNRATVAEQLLYEIGDPAAYELPDVVCDLRQVSIRETRPDRVRVEGARGRPPSTRYKITATGHAGYQIGIMMAIRGQRARAKALRTAEELLRRTRRLLALNGLPDYASTVVELLGAEAMYGGNARENDSREVILRIAASHGERKGLEFLQKESASAGTSMGPGTRSHFGGRADIQAIIKTGSFYIAKQCVPIWLDCEEVKTEVVVPENGEDGPPMPRAAQPARAPEPASADGVLLVPLARLAYARSGDKGDDSNIGVIARSEAYWPVLLRELTAERVREYFSHLVQGEVSRFELPGTGAVNFVLRRALGGGGSSSLRSDPLGKSYAQMLLDLEIPCPGEILQ